MVIPGELPHGAPREASWRCSEGEGGNGGDGGGTVGEASGSSLVASGNPALGLLDGIIDYESSILCNLGVGPGLAAGSGWLGPGECGAVGLDAIVGVVLVGRLIGHVGEILAGLGAGLEREILEGAIPAIFDQTTEVTGAGGSSGLSGGGVGGEKSNSDLGLHL